MIPKVIYMCHKTLEKIIIYSEKWKILNPEYEIRLFNDQMCLDFLLEAYSQLHAEVFNFIPDGPIKADFWRLCIINKYGGLYVDADIEPIIPLKEYIEDDDDFVSCISHNFSKDKYAFQLNPHFILSNKNNEFLQNTIDIYINLYINNKNSYNYWHWSICNLLQIEGINEKKSQVIYLNNQKCKFLLENYNFSQCEYNEIVVLNNRYNNYINHNFT
jgi:mannosyltransferase OCH1-like enzyme